MRRRLITVVILLLLAGGFAYAFFYLDKTSLKLAPGIPTPHVLSTPTPTPTPLSSPGSTPQYLPGQAFSQVQTFYSSYEQNASVLGQYVTPALATQINQGGGTESIYCAPDPPSSISYNPPIAGTDPSTAIVPVHESFVSGTTLTLNVTVSLLNLQITDIACPAAQ